MSFRTTFTVDRTPDEVYAAVLDVPSWWTGSVTGVTDVVGESFTYRYEDQHRSVHQVSELVPGERVVWHTTDADLPFAGDPREWVGTDVVFEITPAGDGAQLVFTHVGLAPDLGCYDACSGAWTTLVGASLRDRVVSGSRTPSVTSL